MNNLHINLVSKRDAENDDLWKERVVFVAFKPSWHSSKSPLIDRPSKTNESKSEKMELVFDIMVRLIVLKTIFARSDLTERSTYRALIITVFESLTN